MTETLNIAGINTGSKLEIYTSPVPVGCWCLYETEGPSLRLNVFKKPTDEQIANTEKLLGWKWKDAE